MTLREKLADMGFDAYEQMQVLAFIEADTSERERKAFVAGAVWCEKLQRRARELCSLISRKLISKQLADTGGSDEREAIHL